ncbi:MAG: hypothetical protein IK115_08745, partial [Lachnospiraceae bacterium]|nr:hypothetical protein [Lachnospiraceae bacterium]
NSMYRSACSDVRRGTERMQKELPATVSRNSSATGTETLFFLYTNEEADAATELMEGLQEKEAALTELSGYSDSVLRPMSDTEISGRLSENGLDIAPEFIHLLFFMHYEDASVEGLPGAEELLEFCRSDMKAFTEGGVKLDSDPERAMLFMDTAGLSEEKSGAELAVLLDLPESLTEKLLLVYLEKHGSEDCSGSFTLSDFAASVKEAEGDDPFLSFSQDKKMKDRLDLIEKFSDPERISAQHSASELAGMLALSQSLVDQAFGKARNEGMRGNTMSCDELVNMMINNMSPFLNTATKDRLQVIHRIMDGASNDTEYTADELSAFLDLDPSGIRKVFLLKQYKNSEIGEWKAAPEAFVSFIREELLTDEGYAAAIGETERESIERSGEQMAAVLGKDTMDREDLVLLFGKDAELISLMYAASSAYDPELKLSLWELLADAEALAADTERFGGGLCDAAQELSEGLGELISGTAEQYVGGHYSRMMISLSLPSEGKERTELIAALLKETDRTLAGEHYLLGAAVSEYRRRGTLAYALILLTILSSAGALVFFFLGRKKAKASMILERAW